MKAKIPGLIAVSATIILTGCATTVQPIAFNGDSIGPNSGRIGVVMTAIPKPNTDYPGANCVLCVLAASAMNSSLSSYAEKLPLTDVEAIRSDTALAVGARGATVILIPDTIKIAELPESNRSEPNAAKRDFSALGRKHQVDKILVIDVTKVGFVRNYAQYIPMGAPKAQFSGAGYLVDVRSNRYEWYKPFAIEKGVSGEWDEPPKYPGLTNAYFQTIELGKSELLETLGGTLVTTTSKQANLVSKPEKK